MIKSTTITVTSGVDRTSRPRWITIGRTRTAIGITCVDLAVAKVSWVGSGLDVHDLHVSKGRQFLFFSCHISKIFPANLSSQ